MLTRPYDPTENFFKPEKLKGLTHEKGTTGIRKRGRTNSLEQDSPKKQIRGLRGVAQRRIPSISKGKTRQEKNKRYEKAKREWRKERKEIDGFRCGVSIGDVACSTRADRNPHHIRGRSGKLLYDKTNFLPACRKHHRHIHDNPAWAREHGYLAYEFSENKS